MTNPGTSRDVKHLDIICDTCESLHDCQCLSLNGYETEEQITAGFLNSNLVPTFIT